MATAQPGIFSLGTRIDLHLEFDVGLGEGPIETIDRVRRAASSIDHSRLDRMLRRMGGVEDGIGDRLTEVSTPSTSAWCVVPPVELVTAGVGS